MSEQTIYSVAVELEGKYPDDEPEAVAAKIVRRLSAAQRDELLLRELSGLIETVRRAKVRELERASAEQTATERRRAEWSAMQDQYESERAERRAYHERYPMYAPKNSRAYREWIVTEPGQRWLANETESQRQAADVRQQIADAGGPLGWLAQQIEDWQRKAKIEGRLELTRELLGSTFALGDGRSVTWGEATLADHQTRMTMLARQTAGTIETISVHQMAVEMLRREQARCLNEIAGVPA